MPTDDEIIDWQLSKMAAYRAVAAYAAAHKVVMLPKVRNYALRQAGWVSREALTYEAPARKHFAAEGPSYSNRAAHADAAYGWDSYAYLERFCHYRAAGHSAKSAIVESWNGMRMVRLNAHLAMDISDQAGRADQSPDLNMCDSPDAERFCLDDAAFAMTALQQALLQSGACERGHLVAFEIAYADLNESMRQGTVKALPQPTIAGAPESALLGEFNEWLGGQRILSRLLQSNIALHDKKQGFGEEENADALMTARFYDALCQNLQSDVAREYADGSYVLKFAMASQIGFLSQTPENTGHRALYSFVEQGIGANLEHHGERFSESGKCRDVFLRASTGLMKEFSARFPIVPGTSNQSINPAAHMQRTP